MTTFIGVSDDPERGVRSDRGGLYEFWTDTGVPVRLHDMSFEGLDYRNDVRPMLVLRFRYDDADWTPPEAVATPVVEMTFDDVSVRLWEEDAEALAEVGAPLGQVGTFDYNEPSEFGLQTYALRLTFSARRVRVRLSAWAGRPAAEPWAGEPSGAQFAAMIRTRAASLGIDVGVEVIPWSPAGLYGVGVQWGGGQDLLFEVADWVDDVRILDPHGEDVSVQEGLEYFAARVSGESTPEAPRRASPSQRSPWQRWRERRG